jgi:glycosyltransferase involved in cell wall biosynthesis
MHISDKCIYVALPAMNESEYLHFCMESLFSQSIKNFKIVVCVNQPEEYWDTQIEICKNNAATIEYLQQVNSPQIIIIDHSSQGKGWKAGKSGIGIARKTIMDFISKTAKPEDIIISMDADTTFDKDYFQSVLSILSDKKTVALANPYYHKLTGNSDSDRAILRYEIYMRNYLINLFLIDSPYAYSALGSAMAFNVSAYNAVGGMTPKKSGEDFYFLQKLKKYSTVAIDNIEKVFPASRFSDRVIFGTGPAMIKGNSGDWSSYPIYHHSLFEKIKETYQLFEILYEKNVETPLDDFIYNQFGEKDIWDKLRLNFKSRKLFVRACHEKIDGLRILQFLKIMQPTLGKKDEQCFIENISFFLKQQAFDENIFIDFDTFDELSVEQLNQIRDYLFRLEDILRNQQKVL